MDDRYYIIVHYILQQTLVPTYVYVHMFIFKSIFCMQLLFHMLSTLMLLEDGWIETKWKLKFTYVWL